MLHWLSAAVSSFTRMIGFSLLCLLIDYSVYFAADVLYARRQLTASELPATNPNAVWRKLCGILLAAAVPIHLVHHRPLVLYLLISVTFLLTLREPFKQFWSKLARQWPILVTVGDAAQRVIDVIIDLAAKWYDGLLLLFGSRKQAWAASSKKTENHFNYSSAFHRFVPQAASTKSTTSSLLDRNGAISNSLGVPQRSLPASTQQLQQQKSLLSGDRRFHSNGYSSNQHQQSLLLQDHQPHNNNYSSQLQQQAAEEEDSLLTNGSLLHPPRRSFLKTSTPVDPAAGVKGSSCHHRA